MDDSAALHGALARAGLSAAAPYAVAMAYRVRFYMELNAREAMHVIELRTAPQGHPAYRRICQAMHRLIADQAGHRALAAAMHHADHSDGESGRREAEEAAERRRQTTLTISPLTQPSPPGGERASEGADAPTDVRPSSVTEH